MNADLIAHPRDVQNLPRKASDRWQAWPAITAIAIEACLSFLDGLPGLLSFLLILLSALCSLVAPPALLVWAGLLAARRRFRRAASVGLALLLPVCLFIPINQATDCLHLALTVWVGIGQLGPHESHSPREFAAYDWSTGLVGSADTFLIHDPTDEIALPLARHRHPIGDENGFGEECAGRVQHLLGHYYICRF